MSNFIIIYPRIKQIMDEILHTELNVLYNFWFENHEKFFSQNDIFDSVITDKFSVLLEKNIPFENTLHYSNSDKIFTAMVILYDQIPRHVYRKHNVDNIIKYLNCVYPFVIENYEKYPNLNPLELSFVLLPLRHTNEFKLINKSIDIVWSKIKNSFNKEHIQQYKKFLHASYTRYSTKNSDAENLYQIVPSDKFEEHCYNNIFNKLYLDEKCWKNNKLIYTSLKNHIVYKTVKDFVTKNNITQGIISLSGGVDSMALSLILNSLNIDLIAVHINYSNRKECCEEEKIVINWCKHVLKIPLFVRTISEINRKDCMKYEMRELYETYTKNIRFNSYKNAQNYNKLSHCNVFTGHNKDDCFENIITNIANKSHRGNLTGMYSHIVLSGINFIRPMLDCSKSNIYDFALIHQIPFFVDSTPKWSQRGKIRDIVRPTLEQWNPMIIDGLFEISDVMKSQSNFVSDRVKEIVINADNAFERTDHLLFTMYINQEHLSKNSIFWKELFVQIGVFISNSSLENFIEKIIKIKKMSLNNHINHNNIIILNKKNRINWIFNGNEIVFKICTV